MSRLVLYQWTQADVACSTSPSRASGPVRNGELSRTHSVLYSPMVISASALSKASPTDPIDGVIPLFTLVGDAPTPTGLHWTVPLKGRSPGMTYATLGAGNGWLHPSRWAVGKIGGRISPDLERAVFSDQHAWKGRYSTPFGATDPAVHWMPQPFFGGSRRRSSPCSMRGQANHDGIASPRLSPASGSSALPRAGALRRTI
jgi:hypothetical protein